MADLLMILNNEKLLAEGLGRGYTRHGWKVQLAITLGQARQRLLQANPPAVVIADTNLPDGNSLDLLEEIRRRQMSTAWIAFNANATVPDSVRAMRLGAMDYRDKPCQPEELADLLQHQGRVVTGAPSSSKGYVRLPGDYSPEAFLGSSAAAAAVRELLARLTAVPMSALIVSGETGTGKGLVARILHHSGQRRRGPLVEVNCAAIPRELLESELFGHESGSFTGARERHHGLFEQAHGGTLFLDEIGEMPLDLQAKVLSVIEDRRVRRVGSEKTFEVDVQLIAASNRSLEQQVRNDAFRADLYHRLSVFQVPLPALRDRLEDLDQLVPAFIEEFNERADNRIDDVDPCVYQRLRAYHWPGNTRELRNVLERAVLLSHGGTLDERWLQLQTPGRGNGRAEVDGDRVIIPLDGSMALDEMDSYIIQTALARNKFNVTATARSIGTTRETLRYRIQKYQLKTRPDPLPATASASKETDQAVSH